MRDLVLSGLAGSPPVPTLSYLGKVNWPGERSHFQNVAFEDHTRAALRLSGFAACLHIDRCSFFSAAASYHIMGVLSPEGSSLGYIRLRDITLDGNNLSAAAFAASCNCSINVVGLHSEYPQVPLFMLTASPLIGEAAGTVQTPPYSPVVEVYGAEVDGAIQSDTIGFAQTDNDNIMFYVRACGQPYFRTIVKTPTHLMQVNGGHGGDRAEFSYYQGKGTIFDVNGWQSGIF